MKIHLAVEVVWKFDSKIQQPADIGCHDLYTGTKRDRVPPHCLTGSNIHQPPQSLIMESFVPMKDADRTETLQVHMRGTETLIFWAFLQLTLCNLWHLKNPPVAWPEEFDALSLDFKWLEEIQNTQERAVWDPEEDEWRVRAPDTLVGETKLDRWIAWMKIEKAGTCFTV